MANCWNSFVGGWVAAAKIWPVVLLLYLVDTAMAIILAIPPAGLLSDLFGHSYLEPGLAGPVTLDLLNELSNGGEAASVPWMLYLLVPLLSVLAGIFFRGGVLGVLSTEPGLLRWGNFFGLCAAHFWRFLLMTMLLVPGLMAVGIVYALLNPLLGLLPSSRWGLWGLAASPALLLFLIYLLAMALDYGRISLVLEPRRSLWHHSGRGLWFMIRRFPQAALMGIGFALVALLFAAAYPALLSLSPFSGALLPALLVQQSSLLLLSWQRVAALGGQMKLYSAFHPARHIQPPEPGQVEPAA